MLELTQGSRLADRYTLERSLGRGGEAVTWLARDRMTRASVALKIVPAAGSARLRNEWQANLRLMHAHIVRVFEFHEDQGAAFYSQQYVDGPDLGALAGKSLGEILPPIGLLADALRYAHAKDMVHRDVKASNVLLDYNGVPYLGDFGVAAAAGTRASGGSPVTASPQVVQGVPAHPSDDIYALGVLLHELIAGSPPGEEQLRSAAGEAIPEEISALVSSMLDNEAAGRPDAQTVIDRLTAAGFRPGPARSQIAARPLVEDEQIERVSAVRHARTTAAEAPQPAAAASRGLNSRTVAGALGVLVVILLGVVFLLPDAVEERDRPRAATAGEEALPLAEDPVAADAAATADGDFVSPEDRVTRDYRPENEALDNERVLFNESDADYSGLDDAEKLRFNVEGILGELLSNFETLERRGVQRWAPVPYKRAQDYYQSGDDAYLRKDWVAAEIAYLDALTVLEPLFEQVEPEFEKALAGAREAFDTGDRAEALRLYELAVAITPNHPEARAGLKRAQNLEAVLQLVDSGERFEEELELDAAEASFQQAIDLDPNWAPAVEGLARVRATRTKMLFDARMSEGLEALAAGDYLSARAAFRMAQQLVPGSREPADGLLQVDQGLRLNNITTLEQEALVLEQSEHWDAAATTYEEILAVDGNLSFAIDGLAQARKMSALHARLDDYIKEPDRLSVPSVMQEATKLVIDVTTMGEIGPRLAGQRDELSRLLKRAATPVTIELVSDNVTDVSIYKIGVLGRFTNRKLELRPGTYVAVGARAGYRDVRLEFRVAPEEEMQPVVVRCEEQI
ncbi:MAG TPA: protein kinase [Woeseiaceae bacterium]|jgi:tetratricopeptide (TPR) repeat protein|nr:protein kinase [Woeseiaceae bacterium]